jgi:hypothetical protein
MSDRHPPRTPSRIRARQIEESDLPEVVNLLTRGYGDARPRQFWQRICAGLSRRAVPAGYPRYGYVIECDGRLVGVILLIYSTIWIDGAAKIRCNGLGLYVDPAFRMYAPLLISRAYRDKTVTVLNISAAPHTHEMVEASGFTKYSAGIMAALPLFGRRPKETDVRIVDASVEPDAPIDERERALVLEHVDFGCTALWCLAQGCAYPFVFRPRKIKRLPGAQLVYCRSVDSFVRFARPIGVYLARRRQFVVILDANGRVPGLIGAYFGNRPKYSLGPDQPRIGDLAYTETSLFGI